MTQLCTWTGIGSLCASVLFALAPAARAQSDDLKKLTAARDALLQSLEQRQADDAKKGPAQDYYLFLDEGADRDELQLALRRRAGAWSTSFGEVPGWMQGTMQEYRGFFLGNGVGGAWRSCLRFPADCANLKLDGDKLSGAMNVAYRLDQTLDEKLPPGTVITWWDRFIPAGLYQPRTQSYTIDATVQKDSVYCELVLEGGVYWDSAWTAPAADKKTGKPVAKGPASINRRPIFVRLQAPCTRFTIAKVQTPTWNGGFHEGDATGLKFENGRLAGVLLVMLHNDGWSPFGGGKTTQHDPLIVKFDIDAKLENHELVGKFDATVSGKYAGLHYSFAGGESMKTEIPETKYNGLIRGRGGRAVLGRYQGKGDVGEQTGSVSGMLIDSPLPLKAQLEKQKPENAAAQAAQLMHQIRALSLANQQYPLPLSVALAQTDIVTPVLTEAEADAYAREAAKVAAAARAPADPLPAAIPESTSDSPSQGAAAMAVEADANILPAQATGWLFAKSWQVLGHIEQRPGLDNDAGLVPDLVIAPGVKYSQPTDRFGAAQSTTRPADWSAISCESPRLTCPGESIGMYVRFGGRAWFGATKIRSAESRKVWLSLEANDFAKLWVNNKLVWVDSEKPWRYRAQGRVIVPVTLEAGDNQLLARVHRDRRLSWLRVAISLTEPGKGPEVATGPIANPFIYPEATPPLAWDIDKGINIAWRNEAFAGNVRPVLAGDALLVTTNPGSLHCLDIATGKPRWTADLPTIDAPEVKDARELRCSEPAFDGQNIYVHGGAGSLGCYDLSGKPKWNKRTNLLRARVHVYKNQLIVHGYALSAFPGAKADLKAKERAIGVLILDAATGEPKHQLAFTGNYTESMSNLVVVKAGDKEVPALLCGADTIVDIAAGKILPRVDLDLPPGAGGGGGAAGYGAVKTCGFSANADTAFWTVEEQFVAVRMWIGGNGQLAYGHRWQSNYEHGGFGSFHVPCLATDKFLFTWCPVLERGPHCPDSKLDLTVQDARTGRPLAKLKPALEGVLHAINPVIAGEYIYCCDSGGGPFAPIQTHGQLVVATANEKLQLVCRNLIELGTNTAPVFAGDKLLLRSPKSLMCIAVTTKEGREYQAKALARMSLIALGSNPGMGAVKEIEPMSPIAPAPTIPVGKLLDNRTTDAWIGAGPFPGTPDDAALAALRPQAGTEITVAGKKLAFAPLSREHAYNDPPKYLRTSMLQGTGDIIPHFSTLVDPRCVSSADGTGLIYTVLDNTHDRVVSPALKAHGTTMWISGQLVKPEDVLHLKPGLYPVLVRIDPTYYKEPAKTVDLPVAVSKALTAKAIDEFAWPTTWQVLGPISPDIPILEEAQLKQMPPATMKIGDQEFTPFEFPIAEKGNVPLGSLVDLQPGQKPDVKNPPKALKIAVPSYAYAFATIDAPADGYLYISASADWYMTWYYDGKPVYDTTKDGNNAAAANPDAHPFSVRVTKGKHVIAVLVKPGTAGWSFASIAGFSTKGPDQLAEYKLQPRQAFAERDLRIAPAFKEIPHPPTRMARWLDKIKTAEPRLRQITKEIPGTPEARAAEMLLREIR